MLLRVLPRTLGWEGALQMCAPDERRGVTGRRSTAHVRADETGSRCSSWREEAFQCMAERDWDSVTGALAAAVGGASLPSESSDGAPLSLPPPQPDWKDRRHTWALKVAYYGPAFASFSWQAEAPLDTVIGCIQLALQPLLASQRPRVSSAGRTDAGVSALGQVVTFSTFEDLDEGALQAAIDAIRPGRLRLLSACKVPRDFHATFSARWRRYVYLLPLTAEDPDDLVMISPYDAFRDTQDIQSCASLHSQLHLLNMQLAPLKGIPRDYSSLARGLPKGKNTMCTLLRARAYNSMVDGGCKLACVELVGDRFLRRQVRTLVATALYLATSNTAGEAMLLERAASGDQRLTAHPAPPYGLYFAEVGYSPWLEN
ncbi:hypothetical protein AB1Y20_009996 [Prymnesium parvum]|uniref:tRNA pseudouridine synthase n=1 Tax=Prymnesium parvum TaxID=97485 RepID=A0AB34K2Q8_PRYPA